MTSKTVRTDISELPIDLLRDRADTFTLATVPKHLGLPQMLPPIKDEQAHYAALNREPQPV